MLFEGTALAASPIFTSCQGISVTGLNQSGGTWKAGTGRPRVGSANDPVSGRVGTCEPGASGAGPAAFSTIKGPVPPVDFGLTGSWSKASIEMDVTGAGAAGGDWRAGAGLAAAGFNQAGRKSPNGLSSGGNAGI